MPKKGAYVIYEGDGSHPMSKAEDDRKSAGLALMYSLRDSGVSKEQALEFIEEVYGSHD